ncbi:MAG: iron ABC transporter permease [Pseudomonadaceae bacterium]|nr:MAG: iron ABC transporter permease [Pseudomonadaceae bacterium]
MPRRCITLLLVALLAGCERSEQTSAEPAGFAGLGAAAEDFAEVVPGQPLRFPEDHGPHPQYRIEWWYLTANLTDADGKDWGIQWTLFRQAMTPQDLEAAADGWNSTQVWLAHAAVTHADGHRHADRLARGGVGHAGVTSEPFRAWIDDWTLHGSGNERLSPLQLSAGGDDFGYELQFESPLPMVPQGEQGYSVKSEAGQASWYLSQPFYQVSGEIEWGGERFAVQGQGWLDREWSSQPLAADQQGWDWFSLHLDSGEKLMLFRLRHYDGGHYYSGTWISAEGTPTPLRPEQISMQPLNRVRVAGRQLATQWQLDVPDHGLAVSTEALNPQSWMATGIEYWEGPIRFSGSHSGVGYLEMTGY